MVSISVSFVAADVSTDSLDTGINGTEPVPNMTGNETLIGDMSLADTAASLVGTKKPMSSVSFSESAMADINNLDEQNAKTEVSDVSPEYESLGEIIAAQDWNALSEYTCKLKAENPGTFDTGSTEVTRERFRRFLSPDPPVVVQSCCG